MPDVPIRSPSLPAEANDTGADARAGADDGFAVEAKTGAPPNRNPRWGAPVLRLMPKPSSGSAGESDGVDTRNRPKSSRSGESAPSPWVSELAFAPTPADVGIIDDGSPMGDAEKKRCWNSVWEADEDDAGALGDVDAANDAEADEDPSTASDDVDEALGSEDGDDGRSRGYDPYSAITGKPGPAKPEDVTNPWGTVNTEPGRGTVDVDGAIGRSGENGVSLATAPSRPSSADKSTDSK